MADYKDLLSTFNLVNPVQKSTRLQDYDVSNNSACTHIDGVIFTDTAVLAQKFSISREYVATKLDRYISQCERLGIRYALLDMAERENVNYITDGKSWYHYHKALYSFIDRNHITTDCSTSVFIIGGDDVVAVPQYVFDLEYDDNGFKIEIDLWYCFQYGFDIKAIVSDTVQRGNYDPNKVEQELLHLANFNISRLPLTNGTQTLSFDSSIVDYLDRSINANMMIDVKSGMMATASQWLNESAFLSEDLPLLPLGNDSQYVYKGIYRSPDIAVDDAESMIPYKETLSNSDFLLFNLHGDVAYPNSGYYGSPRSVSEESPCAFNIPLLKHCKARVLNTTACWGARYIGYSAETSMLLSAIYSSFLLFVGSSHIALGKFPNGEYPCGCSETLLKMYIERLLSGEKAGEALLRAKIRYFAYFISMDSLRNAYYTICEFNLFGVPSIRCRTSISKKSTYSDFEMEQRYSSLKRPESLNDVYERVRNLIDEGLDEISSRLEAMLTTQYGYNDVRISRVNRIVNSSVHIGYNLIFTYNWGCTGYISVRTDKQGNPSAIYYTK